MLSAAELGEWVERLRPDLAPRAGLRGPVWFLWGNAHSDQPIRSANALAALLRADAQAAMPQPQGATAAAAAAARRSRTASPRGGGA